MWEADLDFLDHPAHAVRWHEMACLLERAAPEAVPVHLEDFAIELRSWPDAGRRAAAEEAGGAEATWWRLGCAAPPEGQAASLVRWLAAGTSAVLALPPGCGWRRSLHRRCRWRPTGAGGPDDITAAATLLGVRHLDLAGCSNRAAAAEVAQAAARTGSLASLERLGLHGLGLGGLTAPRRAPGAPQPRLRMLDLGANGLGARLRGWVRGLAAPGRLRDLRVPANAAQPADLRFLAVEGYLPGLVALDIGGNRLDGPAVLALLQEAAPARRLRALGLDGLPGLGPVLPGILAPGCTPRLRHVSLGNAVRASALLSLAARGLLDRLRHLDLRGAHFDAADVEALLAMRRPPRLRVVLDLRDIPERRDDVRAWLRD